jgi:hypothetical protein
MASIRDRLIDALFAALNSSTPAGAGTVPKPASLLVVEERLHPNEQSQLPVIGLYFEDEEPQPLEKQRYKAPTITNELGVELQYRALASVPGQAVQKPRKVIDPLYLWAMQQMGADESFGGLAMGIIPGPTKWLSKESNAIVAAAAQRFTIHYRTSRLNPSATS